MSEIELYDFTRGQWKLSKQRAEHAKYAFVVYEGIIQELYSVLLWIEAGKTLSTRNETEALKGRYEFIGNIAEPEIRNKYKYKSVEHYFKRGNANPIMYLNC